MRGAARSAQAASSASGTVLDAQGETHVSKKNRAPRLTRKERRTAEPSGMEGPLKFPEIPGTKVMQTTNEALGLRPMSEVLQDFVAPLFEGQSNPSRNFVERVFSVGTVVWNATAPAANPAHLGEALELLERMSGDPDGARQLFAVLAQRRLDLFFDDPRTIADVKLDWTGPRLRVSVASTVNPKHLPGVA